MNESNFTKSERRIIKAMYKLDRWATKNEIAKWADDMSWNTANIVLDKLHKKKIVDLRSKKDVHYWKIRNF